MDIDTAYLRRKRDEEFARQWEEALQDGVEVAEAEAWDRALDRSDPDSARLLILILKGRKRHVYGDRVDVSSTLTIHTIEEKRLVLEAAEADPEAFVRVARALGAGGDGAA